MPDLRDRGAALFILAQDYARVGDLHTALSLLKQCISLDEGFDPSGDPAFARLKLDPEYQELVTQVHRRYPAVHRARVAFTIGEKNLIPEGLAFSSKTGMLYMSSLNLRKIVKITSQGAVSDFVKTGQDNLGPVCGLAVDRFDGGLWANVCRDSGVGSELLRFDNNGHFAERFSAPTSGQHLFNDVVIRNPNEIYVTDSVAHRVYKIDRRSQRFFEVRLSRAVYYPNGISLSGDGNLLYIADAFGILVVDLSKGTCGEVESGRTNTLAGADGLYWWHNSLVAVQNGVGSPRLAQFHLSPDGLRVVGVAILESRSTSVILPTTGAINGSKFYFMSNTQVDNFRDEKIIDPNKLEPVQISVLELEN